MKVEPEVSLRLATDIAVAYLGRNALPREEVALLIGEIRTALLSPIDFPDAPEAAPSKEEGAASETTASVASGAPAVPIDQSITDDYLVSLEDGQRYRSLRRHLMAKYGMTPDDYRRKWGLADDYPMVAPSYARDRSEVAKRTGLGRPKTPAVVEPRRKSGARRSDK